MAITSFKSLLQQDVLIKQCLSSYLVANTATAAAATTTAILPSAILHIFHKDPMNGVDFTAI